jgi:LPXTG-motif cell wall-anchored protein
MVAPRVLIAALQVITRPEVAPAMSTSMQMLAALALIASGVLVLRRRKPTA